MIEWHQDEQEVETYMSDLDRLIEFYGDRERAKLVMWRLEVLTGAGFSLLHAAALAVLEDRDPWREALVLVQRGAHPAVATRIVLP